MRLFLVRHGTAEEKLGRPDPERALTRQGRDEVGDVCGAIAAALDPPVQLLSSPYLRAEQTAEVIRELLKLDAKILPTEALLPESDWPSLRGALEKLDVRGAETVVAVGHNPSISMMVGSIVAGQEDARISMAKGAAACLDIEHLHGRPAGELRWLVTPKAIRGARKGSA